MIAHKYKAKNKTKLSFFDSISYCFDYPEILFPDSNMEATLFPFVFDVAAFGFFLIA